MTQLNYFLVIFNFRLIPFHLSKKIFNIDKKMFEKLSNKRIYYDLIHRTKVVEKKSLELAEKNYTAIEFNRATAHIRQRSSTCLFAFSPPLISHHWEAHKSS